MELSEQQLRQIFRDSIEPTLFLGTERSAAPELVMLGGQPVPESPARRPPSSSGPRPR